MAAPGVYAKCIELQIKSLEEQLRLLREVANVSSEETSSKKKKPKKGPVDPNKPKRPHSAYQLFIMELLPQLKLKLPDVQQKDLMSQAASAWNGLDEASKEKYNRAAYEEKGEHQRQMLLYSAGIIAGGEADGEAAATPVMTATNPVPQGTESSPPKKKKDHHKEKKRKSIDEAADNGSKKKKKKKSSKE